MNPDGSEAEKSGNGLRIFARYLYDTGVVKNELFTVDTLGGKVTCQIAGGADSITVDMGQVRFGGTEQSEPKIDQSLTFNGKTQTVYIADIGNPHCVLVQDEISAKQAHDDGALIEVHPSFPNRTLSLIHI